MLTLVGEIEGICSVRHEVRFYLGDRSKIIGGRGHRQGAVTFFKKKISGAKTFLQQNLKVKDFIFQKQPFLLQLR